jgi:peptidyl-dipeptidase A
MSSLPSHRLVDLLQDRFRDLEIEFRRAYWDSQVEATPERDARREELELELRRTKGDPGALEAVTAALGEDIHEPLLRRQLEVLRLSLTANQMDDATREEIVGLSSAIESEFASYRPEVDGRRLDDNAVHDVLAGSDDQELRKRTWEASKEIGAVVEERVRELARLRNDAARDLGFADYYRMSLDLGEMSEEWLFGLLDEVERFTEAPFTKWKAQLDSRLRSRFEVETLYPWHYGDAFFQELPPDGRVSVDPLIVDTSPVELAERSFELWGIDLSRVMAASDLYPRDRKCPHAFCLDVDRSGEDVRILANVVPGERWTSVMLHESGHAAYDMAIDPQLPYLLHRPAHVFTTEAVAILSGRLVRRPGWLSRVAGAPQEEVARIAQSLEAAGVAQDLLMARWIPVMAHFERELYSDPEGDLNSKWWELVERFQMVTPPPGRDAPDWAAKIHISVAPVYYHNYLLGAMLASQLEAACAADLGGRIEDEQMGEWLTHRLFRAGSLLKWSSLVEEATGRPLAADDFAAYVSRSRPLVA